MQLIPGSSFLPRGAGFEANIPCACTIDMGNSITSVCCLLVTHLYFRSGSVHSSSSRDKNGGM